MPTYPLKWGSARLYQLMPLSMAKGQGQKARGLPRWRIELVEIGPGVEPLGLDILGEMVIGRGKSEPNAVIDLDMRPYGGADLGVSRRHAMLKPTTEHLYLVDMGSTNGTTHNGTRVAPGTVRPLEDNDKVALGRLTFTVRIIDNPEIGDDFPQTGSSPLPLGNW